MKQSEIHSHLSEVKNLIKQIQEATPFVTTDRVLFLYEPVNLDTNRLSQSEMAFIKIVSWLYVIYIDNKDNKLGFEFIDSYIKRDEKQNEHKDIIHSFRTWLQHELSFTKQED
jgi:hypothetical protein